MGEGEYWKKRFAQLEEAQNRTGAEAAKEIEAQYAQAQRQIEGRIAAWYQRFADNNEITLAEARQWMSGRDLKEFRWDVNEYIRRGKENALTGAWVKELENASAKFHVSKLEALKIHVRQSLEELFAKQGGTVRGAMGEVYRSGYYRTAYELQKGFRIGWDIAGIDQAQLEKVLSKPWALDGLNFSERIWNGRDRLIREIHGELSRGVMLGSDPQKAIDAVAKKMNTSKSSAGRLVMTEEAYFASLSRQDCFRSLGVEQYEIVATLDSHTSEICRDMDGKHFPMAQWETGVTAPPFHVWCRSTVAPYFEDEAGQPGERAARGADGKTYNVPGDMTYRDWEKAFVDGDKSGLTTVSLNDSMDSKNTPETKTENFFDGTALDRKSLAEGILKEYGVKGVPVEIKDMRENGYCGMFVKDDTLIITEYSLNAGDKRSAEYQIKTVYHEAYHASGNGYATDINAKNTAKWLDLEETFAETSAHYKLSLRGITDLAPSYPDKLISMLPRLKQLPEFSNCVKLIDFGKVALEARQNGGGSVWMKLSKEAMQKKFSYSDYVAQYFSEIRNDVIGYVDKILEKMPKRKKHRENMIKDLKNAMDNIEKFGYTSSDKESLMLNNAVAVAMNRVGVK